MNDGSGRVTVEGHQHTTRNMNDGSGRTRQASDSIGQSATIAPAFHAAYFSAPAGGRPS